MDSAWPVLIPPLAAAIIAVMAAAVAWALATPLLRDPHHPTVPERLVRWTGQHRAVIVFAYIPLLLTGRHMAWSLPLAWLGLQVTTHRVRRRLYGDTWSLAGQVWWNVRAFIALHL